MIFVALLQVSLGDGINLGYMATVGSEDKRHLQRRLTANINPASGNSAGSAVSSTEVCVNEEKEGGPPDSMNASSALNVFQLRCIKCKRVDTDQTESDESAAAGEGDSNDCDHRYCVACIRRNASSTLVPQTELSCVCSRVHRVRVEVQLGLTMGDLRAVLPPDDFALYIQRTLEVLLIPSLLCSPFHELFKDNVPILSAYLSFLLFLRHPQLTPTTEAFIS